MTFTCLMIFNGPGCCDYHHSLIILTFQAIFKNDTIFVKNDHLGSYDQCFLMMLSKIAFVASFL